MANYEKEITLAATLENMDSALGMIEEGLKQAGCPAKMIRQIVVCVEEVYVNVVNYAYDKPPGSCTIRFVTEDLLQNQNMSQCLIELRDAGKQFNPLEKEDPDITLSAEERKIGGLGIYMVKNIMDQVTYRYDEKYNILTMTKSWERCDTNGESKEAKQPGKEKQRDETGRERKVK